MGLYTLVIVAMYPIVQGLVHASTTSPSRVPARRRCSASAGRLTSPTGWLNANIYNNFLPLIVLLIAIGYGASCIAGQDEDLTLGFVATLPLTRRRIGARSCSP